MELMAEFQIRDFSIGIKGDFSIGNKEKIRVASIALRILRQRAEQFELNHITSIDNDDVIWIPVNHNLPVPSDLHGFDWVLIDDAQELSNTEIALVSRIRETSPHARFFVVGDPNEAIYQFRGAGVNAMEKLRHILPSRSEFSLLISRRCPQHHIELAKIFVPAIQHSEQQGSGIVAFKTPEQLDSEVQGGDVVICRWAPATIKLAHKLVRSGR